MSRRIRLVAAALFLTSALGAAQAPPVRVVRLDGRVLDNDTGLPVRNARVAVRADGLAAPVVLADADGRFTLPVPENAFAVQASKTGYAPDTVLRRELVSPLEIRLSRSAAIGGRIVDEFGEPAVGIRLAAERVTPGSDQTTTAAQTMSDDLGEFRLGGLAPGRYVVAVTMLGPDVVQILDPTRNVRVMTGGRARTTYYPDAVDRANAQVFDLTAGAEVNTLSLLVDSKTAAGGNPYSVFRSRMAAPPIARGTGHISGVVTDAAGRPLPGVDISMEHATARRVEVATGRTGRDGSFEFDDLPPGSFRLSVSKTGYLPVTSGSLPSFRTARLDDGGSARVDLSLTKWSTITGRVLDEFGDPIQGAAVQVLQIRYESGRRRLVGTGSTAAPTDDRGVYRVFALQPGAYIVSAAIGEVSSADVPGYTRTYYPGTIDTSLAEFVDVRRGDMSGIDFALTRARTANVSGRLLDPKGGATTGGTVIIRESDRFGGVTSVPLGARIANDGTFVFPNVPDGQYVIQAFQGRKNQTTEGDFAAVPVVVTGADVTGLVVQMTGGSDIYGRVEFQGQGDAPADAHVEITTVPVDYDTSPPNGFASSTADTVAGRFELHGIHGVRRLRVDGIPDGWALDRILVRGADATDRPLIFGGDGQSLAGVEVLLTDRVTALQVTVADRDGGFVPGIPVILFPIDRDAWYGGSRYLRMATADAQGDVSMEGLPFGTYYVAPAPRLPDEGADAWQAPAFLESLIPDASSVTLTEGRTESVALRLAR